MINKILIHETICKELNETYKKKNADYGDSVGELYAKLGDITLLTRISDKYNRLMNLLDPKKEGEVNYESVDDTILDMANYCIIWLMERMIRHEETMKLKELSTLENKTSFDEGKKIFSKGYQNESQVQQTVNGLEIKVSQSGGYRIGLSEDNIKNIESIEKDANEMFTNLKDYVKKKEK